MALWMIPPVRSSSPQHLQPALLDRRFDRVVVDLIKMNYDTALEIRFLAKWHVHKTERVVIHEFDYVNSASVPVI